MTDEPENMTLKLLREMRAEQERLASMLGKVADAVTQIAETQELHTEVLTRHSGILSTILQFWSTIPGCSKRLTKCNKTRARA